MQVDYKTLTSHTGSTRGDNVCHVCPCSATRGILLRLLGYAMQTHTSVSQTGDAHLGCKHRRTGGKRTRQHCHAFSATEPRCWHGWRYLCALPGLFCCHGSMYLRKIGSKMNHTNKTKPNKKQTNLTRRQIPYDLEGKSVRSTAEWNANPHFWLPVCCEQSVAQQQDWMLGRGEVAWVDGKSGGRAKCGWDVLYERRIYSQLDK